MKSLRSPSDFALILGPISRLRPGHLWRGPALLLLLTLLLQCGPQIHAQMPMLNSMRSVSVPVRSCVSGGGGSYLESVTSDGRFVVFASAANNLVPSDDRLPYLDVFVREVASQETRLVSVSRFGGGGADRDASQGVVDASGRWVAFVSSAGNLTSDKTDTRFTDVFVRDLQRGVTRLISRSGSTGQSGNGDSGGVRLSKDGRWIVFESEASDLVAGDGNGLKDVFAWDNRSEALSLVSVSQGGIAPGNGISGDADLSADGRIIAFTSTATDLVPGATTGLREIFVRDLVAGVTTWASALKEWCDPRQPGVSRSCGEPVVSDDGRYVVYRGGEVRGVQVGLGVALCRYDRGIEGVAPSWRWVQLMVGPAPVVLSEDGRFAACEASPAAYYQSISIGSVYRVDFETQVPCGAEFFPTCEDGIGRPCPLAVPVVVDARTRKPIPSQAPAISADGSRVAFRFPSSALASLTAPVSYSIAIAEISSGQIRPVVPLPRTSMYDGDLGSTSLRFASEGMLLFFDTDRADLEPEDRNLASDVYRFDVPRGDFELLTRRDLTLPSDVRVGSSDVAMGGLSRDAHAIAFLAEDANRTWEPFEALLDLFVRDEFVRQTSPVTGFWSTNAVLMSPPTLQSVASLEGEFALDDSGRYLAYVLAPTARPTWIAELRWVDRLTGRDLRLDQPSMILPRSGEPAPFGRPRVQPSMSADGSKIVFVASQGEQSLIQRIFLADLHQWAPSEPTLQLVSVGERASTGAVVHCGAPKITADGSRVFFLSTDSALSPQAVRGGQTNLFVRHLVRGDTELCSRSLLNKGLEGQVVRFSVSDPNGSTVAYWTSLGEGFVWDAATATERRVCAECKDLTLSTDGRRVAYVMRGAGRGAGGQIFAEDLVSAERWLVSERKGGSDQPGDAASWEPQITPDGRWVIFASSAGDLVEGDDNRVSDLFLRDLAGRKTVLLTRSHWGAGSANGSSSRPRLSADGATVVFRSFASDLIESDFNASQDLFALRLRENDADDDGLPDDWERAFQGGLDSRPSDDLDGDGLTSAEEWQAGTDPTDTRSVLKIESFQIAPGGSGGVLVGTGAPWHRYQLQHRDSVESGVWRDTGDAVVASPVGLVQTRVSLPASATRFLRFIEKP